MAETVIGDWTYKLDHVDAERSGRLFFRLTQVLGTFLPSIKRSIDTTEAKVDLGQEAFKKALRAIHAERNGETLPEEDRTVDPDKIQTVVDRSSDFADALGKALSEMEPDKAFEVVRDLCELTTALRPSGQYEPVVFAQHFSGCLEDAYDLAFWVAVEEYQDLFRKVLARFRGARTTNPEASQQMKSDE